MMHSTISTWFSGALYLAMLGCGLYYMVFGQKLRERRDEANAAGGSRKTAKPPPDYFRLGLVLAICGAGLLYLNFLR